MLSDRSAVHLLRGITYIIQPRDLNSVTRFGELSPLWQKFTSIWQIFDSLFLIWQNAEHILAHL